MARNLELNVVSSSKDAGLRAAAADVDKLKRAADDLGDEFRKATRDAEKLDRQLAETAAAAALLAKEFSKTGDAGVKKQLDAQRSAATELKKLRADIIGNTEVDAKRAGNAWERAAADLKRNLKKTANDAGKDSSGTFASAFQGGILQAFTKNPALIAAGATIGAALAIPIGAAIGGAILAGAGAGAAGLAGFAAVKADKSGQVAGAAAGLGGDLNKQLLAGGADAIKPLIGGINQLRAAVKDIHLDEIIREGAKYIGPLARGAGEFAGYMSDAALSLTKAAGPEIKVLANELPEIGRAISIAADDIAGGSEGGAKGLRDLLQVIEGVIVGTGAFVGGAERALNAVDNFGHGLESTVQHLRDTNGAAYVALAGVDALTTVFDPNKTQAFAVSLDGAAHGLDGVNTSAQAAGPSLEQVKTDAQAATQAFLNLTNQMLGLDNAALAVASGEADLSKALGEGKRTLDEATQAGRNHVGAILSQIGNLETLREKTIQQGGSTTEANRKFEAGVAAIRANAIALGYNAAQVDALIAKYRTLNGLPNINKSVTLTTHYRSDGTPSAGFARYPGGGMAHGGIRRAASGMLIPPSNPGTVLTGEPQTGGEALIPLKGISRQRAMSLTQTVGNSYGFNVTAAAGMSPRVPTWGGAKSGGAPAPTLSLSVNNGADSAVSTMVNYLLRSGLVTLFTADGVPVRVA